MQRGVNELALRPHAPLGVAAKREQRVAVVHRQGGDQEDHDAINRCRWGLQQIAEDALHFAELLALLYNGANGNSWVPVAENIGRNLGAQPRLAI